MKLRPATAQEWLGAVDLRNSEEMRRYEHPDIPLWTTESEREWWDSSVVGGKFQTWSILHEEQHVGFINAFDFRDAPPSCETGVMIFPQHWGRGIATRAYQKLLALLRDDLQFTETWVGVHPHNKAALRVFEKLGFHPDGVMPDPPIAWLKFKLSL